MPYLLLTGLSGILSSYTFTWEKLRFKLENLETTCGGVKINTKANDWFTAYRGRFKDENMISFLLWYKGKEYSTCIWVSH